METNTTHLPNSHKDKKKKLPEISFKTSNTKISRLFPTYGYIRTLCECVTTVTHEIYNKYYGKLKCEDININLIICSWAFN